MLVVWADGPPSRTVKAIRMQRQTENVLQPGRWPITAAVLVWTLFIGVGFLWILQEDRQHVTELARAEARGVLRRTLELRRWVDSQGGIYVPVGDGTPPRPVVSRVPERAVPVPSERRLALLQSWDLLRRLSEAADAPDAPRLKLAIRRPESAEEKAEAWELEALRALEQGSPEVGEIVDLQGVPHLRLMHPLFVEPGCGVADEGRGFREGDLCGGMSVALPLRPQQTASAARMRGHALTYVSVWLVGLLGIAYGARQIRTRFQERRQAEERLEKWEALLAVAVEQSPSGILIADAPDVQIQYANRAALAIRGHSKQLLEGIPVKAHSAAWQTFLPDGVTPFPSEQLPLSRAVLEGVVSDQVEAVIRREDGEGRWVTANAGPVRNKSGEIVAGIVVFHDVTERKRAEEAVRLDEARLEALLQLNQMSEASFADIVEFAMEEAVRLTQSEIGYVAFASEDESVLTMYAWSKTAMRQCAVEEMPRVYRVATTGLWGEAVRQRRPVITNDYAAPNPWKRGTPSGHVPLRRHMNTPIFAGERIVIVAGVGNKQTDYDQADVRQLTLLMTGLWRIVERKRAEAALRESRQQFQELVETLSDCIWEVDALGRFTYVSPRVKDLLGYGPEELLGKTALEFMPPDEAVRLAEMLTKRPTELGPWTAIEHVLRGKDGRTVTFETSGAPFFDLQGALRGFRGIHRDVSERRRAERRLQASEFRLRQTEQIARVGGCLANPESDRLECTEGLKRLAEVPLDYEPRLAEGLSFIAPEYRAELMRLLRETFATGKPNTYECELVTSRGRRLWTEVHGVLSVGEGESRSVAATFRDITVRKRMEQAIRDERDRAQQYLDVAAVIFVALDAEGRVTLINRKGCEVLGYAEAELLGRSWFGCCLPVAVREETERLFRELISGAPGAGEYHENAVLTKAGEERIVAWRNKLIWDDRQRIIGSLSSGEDITERKHAEEALRRSELLNRRLVEHLPQSVFVKDRNSAFVFCNANFSQPLGLTPEQMTGLDDFAFYPQELAEKYRADDRRVMETGKTSDFEELNRVGDRERWVHVVKVPYRDERGEVIGVMGIFEDITERKQAEGEIRRLNLSLEERVRERTARWEAANKDLEAFSYSVSHDLRAPLRAINGYARMLAEGFSRQLDVEGLRILGVVSSEAERMGRLIDELLNFSRLGRGGIHPVLVDMTALVREVCAQCGPSLAHRQVDLEVAPLPPAVADLSLVRQVWTNLIDNALKFTRRQDRARIEIGGWAGERENVYFVKDNGAGFDMKYADKLFRFFQRLHGQHEFEGNGVGLALVQRIIQLHNGRVWVEAGVDRGAMFHFALPLAGEGEP